MKPTLLLFDIDGTLVLTGGAGKRAMRRTLSDVFGVKDGLSGVNFAGRTDSELVSSAFMRAGLPDTAEARARFREAYLPLLAEEIEHPGEGVKAVMPGAQTLLDTLRDREGAYLALLTGNYREAARLKLAHFALWDFFRWGAFGEESMDRNELARIAMRRAPTMGVPPAAMSHVIVIGDTPNDIACAGAIGARAVAVATGGYTVQELRRAGAEIVLQDLAKGEAVLALL